MFKKVISVLVALVMCASFVSVFADSVFDDVTEKNYSWAVKEIQKRARDKNNEVVVQSAIAEANLIKQLDHSSIVRIVDIIETPDVIYIVESIKEALVR